MFYPNFSSFWVRLCLLLSHLFRSSLKLIFRFHEVESGGNSEEKEKEDYYSGVIREEQEDCDACKNGGLENTTSTVELHTVPSGDKYEFVQSGEMMTGFIEEPRILKFTIHEAASYSSLDDERFESYGEKNFQGDEFDAENGWDFFDLSLIEKLVEVEKSIPKFTEDDDHDDDTTTESPEEEEEEVEFDSGGFSTEEEFELRGLELVSETASMVEELISEIDDLEQTELETGEVDQTKETTVETEKTEDSVSGLVIEEEDASGERLTAVPSSFRNEEAEISPTENCVSPIKEYHFFPYRTIYEGSEQGNLAASIDEAEVQKTMESDHHPESSDFEIEFVHQNEEDDDYEEEEEEFIELDPGNPNSASSTNDHETMEQEPTQVPETETQVEPSLEETSFFFPSSDADDDDDTDDALWEHDDIVEQLKMELRQARTGGLPTILEEPETEEPPDDSPRVVQELLKPLKIDDEKVEYKDLIDGIHKVYRNYSDRMKKLDILNFQTMHAAGLLQLKETVLSQPPSRRYSIPAMKSVVLHNLCKLGKVAVEPMRKIVVDMQRDFEVVYVGQLCLSWEILHWQFWKSLELMKFDSSGSSHRYNQVAGEFQLFQVLVQRFVENEAFLGPRVQNYVKDRCVVRNLLQVPMIKEDSLKEDKETEEGDYEFVITSETLAETIDRSMRLFWEFLRADNETNSLPAVSQPHLHPHDQDTTNSELFHEVRSEFHKKDKKLKEILKTGNCLLKKFQRHNNPQDAQKYCTRQREVIVAQIELKLVSRVLSMNSITAEQLIWCHEKLGKVRLCNRKVSVEPSFLLFPC